jgi:hypothetical protein
MKQALAFAAGRRAASRLAATALLLALGGCYDFQPEAPEDAPQVFPPSLVTVTIEYRQPNLCSASSDCDQPVQFSASWLPQNTGIPLRRVAANFWTGVARDVPVNYPPQDDPHVVRVYDPYLRDTAIQGFTAARLKVGGEPLSALLNQGTPQEVAYVYVDASGLGHSPF